MFYSSKLFGKLSLWVRMLEGLVLSLVDPLVDAGPCATVGLGLGMGSTWPVWVTLEELGGLWVLLSGITLPVTGKG